MAVNETSPTWYRSSKGWALVAVYVVVVVAGAVVSAEGAAVLPEWSYVTMGDTDGALITIDRSVYLFAAFGALLWGLRAIVRPGDQSMTGAGSGPTADGDGSTADGADASTDGADASTDGADASTDGADASTDGADASTDGADASTDGADGSSADADGSSAQSDAGTGGGSLFAGEPRALVLRPFAALPLAAGLYLFSGVLAGSATPSTGATAVLALFAGLYLHRAYERLGRIADSLRRGDERDLSVSAAPPSSWYRRPRGMLLVGVYLVVAVGLVVVTATGDLVSGLDLGALPIPVEVYLYGLLGVMGRIFTELIRDDHVPVEKLALRGLRIPMATMLAGAVYLVVQLPSPPEGATSVPLVGLVFVVGLYEGVGFHYIAAAGRRLLPTASEDAAGDDATGGTGGEAAADATDE